MIERIEDHRRELSVGAARVWGMLFWLAGVLALLVIGGFALVMAGPGAGGRDRELALTWMTVSLIVILIGLPGASALHWYLFRRHWRAGLITPSGFLQASLLLWAVFFICALIPLIGCFASGTIFPNIYLASIVLLLMLGTWPKGEAMVRAQSQTEEDTDDEVMHFGRTPDEQEAQ
jgi:hypothetical protein